MAWVEWRAIKRRTCKRVGEEVELEVKVVYPDDIMPDRPPRVIAHRCSRGLDCNQLDTLPCHWAGASQGYDPFR